MRIAATACVNAGQFAVYEDIPESPRNAVAVEDVLLNRRPYSTERLLEIVER